MYTSTCGTPSIFVICIHLHECAAYVIFYQCVQRGRVSSEIKPTCSECVGVLRSFHDFFPLLVLCSRRDHNYIHILQSLLMLYIGCLQLLKLYEEEIKGVVSVVEQVEVEDTRVTDYVHGLKAIAEVYNKVSS